MRQSPSSFSLPLSLFLPSSLDSINTNVCTAEKPRNGDGPGLGAASAYLLLCVPLLRDKAKFMF